MADLIFEKLICEKHDKGNYYSIQYLNLNDGSHHIGYSSYSLDIVSDYIKNYFINEKSDTERHAHWVKNEDGLYHCENCPHYHYPLEFIKELEMTNCPHCGCKMNKDKEQ